MRAEPSSPSLGGALYFAGPGPFNRVFLVWPSSVRFPLLLVIIFWSKTQLPIHHSLVIQSFLPTIVDTKERGREKLCFIIVIVYVSIRKYRDLNDSLEADLFYTGLGACRAGSRQWQAVGRGLLSDARRTVLWGMQHILQRIRMTWFHMTEEQKDPCTLPSLSTITRQIHSGGWSFHDFPKPHHSILLHWD